MYGRTPPGAQANYERWSMAFFTRPGDSVILEVLADQSPMIAEAIANMPENKFKTGSTALEWFSRRIKNWKIANQTVNHSIISVSRGLTQEYYAESRGLS